MIFEIAQIDVRKGVEAQFEAKVAEAMPLFRRAKGCHAMELHRCIETPGRYRLVVQWQSVEHHTVDFRQSADFAAWRAMVGQYFESPPVVEHTRRVWFGFGPQASGS